MEQFVKDVTSVVAQAQRSESVEQAHVQSAPVVELRALDLSLVGGGLVSPCFA